MGTHGRPCAAGCLPNMPAVAMPIASARLRFPGAGAIDRESAASAATAAQPGLAGTGPDAVVAGAAGRWRDGISRRRPAALSCGWRGGPAMTRRTGHRRDRLDVAVVGAGVVGAACALALAQLGLEVALVEAVPPPSGRRSSGPARLRIRIGQCRVAGRAGRLRGVQQTRAQPTGACRSGMRQGVANWFSMPMRSGSANWVGSWNTACWWIACGRGCRARACGCCARGGSKRWSTMMMMACACAWSMASASMHGLRSPPTARTRPCAGCRHPGRIARLCARGGGG